MQYFSVNGYYAGYTFTNAGFELRVHATLIALICTNMNEQSRYVMHDTAAWSNPVPRDSSRQH